LARILCASESEAQAKAAAQAIERKFDEFLDSEEQYRTEVVQMRALEAPLKMIRGESRWQVFIKLYARGAAGAILAQMEKLSREAYEGVQCSFSINPANML
jgi:primosomal protein N'